MPKEYYKYKIKQCYVQCIHMYYMYIHYVCLLIINYRWYQCWQMRRHKFLEAEGAIIIRKLSM